MKKLNIKDVLLYVEQNIGNFHQKRIQSLDGLKLANVLKRKNPYLFKVKYVLTAEQIIKGLVDAHISTWELGLGVGVESCWELWELGSNLYP